MLLAAMRHHAMRPRAMRHHAMHPRAMRPHAMRPLVMRRLVTHRHSYVQETL